MCEWKSTFFSDGYWKEYYKHISLYFGTMDVLFVSTLVIYNALIQLNCQHRNGTQPLESA